MLLLLPDFEILYLAICSFRSNMHNDVIYSTLLFHKVRATAGSSIIDNTKGRGRGSKKQGEIKSTNLIYMYRASNASFPEVGSIKPEPLPRSWTCTTDQQVSKIFLFYSTEEIVKCSLLHICIQCHTLSPSIMTKYCDITLAIWCNYCFAGFVSISLDSKNAQ